MPNSFAPIVIFSGERVKQHNNVMLKSKIFIAFILFEAALLCGAYLHSNADMFFNRPAELQAKRALVSRLGLTDLAIWTEARYTRHPSQTDFFSAFQDFPGSPDHFPAGSLMAPIQVISGRTE